MNSWGTWGSSSDLVDECAAISLWEWYIIIIKYPDFETSKVIWTLFLVSTLLGRKQYNVASFVKIDMHK